MDSVTLSPLQNSPEKRIRMSLSDLVHRPDIVPSPYGENISIQFSEIAPETPMRNETQIRSLRLEVDSLKR